MTRDRYTDNELQAAIQAFKAGRHDTAAAVLEPLCEPADADPRALRLAALVAHRLGHPDRAAAYFERVLAADPNDVDSLYNLGVLEQSAGQLEGAERRYRAALDSRPDHKAAALNLAGLLQSTGRDEEALRVQRGLADRLGGDADVLAALAMTLSRRGDHVEAERLMQRALDSRPGDAGLHNRLGIVRRAGGDIEGAIRSYRRALELRTGYAEAWNNLGLALQAGGRIEEALEAFERAVAARSGYVEALSNLGALLTRMERNDRAQAVLERAIEADPSHANAWANLAALLSASREPEVLKRGEEAARRAIETDKRLAGAWNSLGICLLKLGREDEAFEAGSRALQLADDKHRFRLHLAELYTRAGRLPEAEEQLREAVQDPSPTPESYRQLGVVRLRRGNAEEALAQLERCLESAPRDQRALAHKGIALELLGRVSEARDLLGLDRFIAEERFLDLAPYSDIEEFHQALENDIRNHPTLRFEPVGLAARGGSLTGNLLDVPTDSIGVVERELRGAIDRFRESLQADPEHPFLSRIPERYRLNLWATLVPEQGEISSHIHEQSWLSGAYYVSLPEAMEADAAENAGWIEFGRPSAELPSVPDGALRCIQPREGLLLLFPSYLYHRTLPFRGAGERISMSFDLVPMERERKEQG